MSRSVAFTFAMTSFALALGGACGDNPPAPGDQPDAAEPDAGALECGPAPGRAGCVGWDGCDLDARDSLCGGEVWVCDPASGEWRLDGFCDPGFLHVRGEMTLTPTVASTPAGCPSLEARSPLVLWFTADEVATPTAPLAVVSISTDTWSRPAHSTLTLTDSWLEGGAETAVELALTLDLEDSGELSGTGTATSATCTSTLTVIGTYHPEWTIGG